MVHGRNNNIFYGLGQVISFLLGFLMKARISLKRYVCLSKSSPEGIPSKYRGRSILSKYRGRSILAQLKPVDELAQPKMAFDSDH